MTLGLLYQATPAVVLWTLSVVPGRSREGLVWTPRKPPLVRFRGPTGEMFEAEIGEAVGPREMKALFAIWNTMLSQIGCRPRRVPTSADMAGVLGFVRAVDRGSKMEEGVFGDVATTLARL